ncbi:MAG: hypothetical protein MZV65_15020 [Chromatiales bacterium]|nr:hypothetical protein [Chromatiales bacterium]
MANPRPASTRILSCGVVVVHWNRDHHDYLLLRAYNYWDFPKGVVEVGRIALAGGRSAKWKRKPR